MTLTMKSTNDSNQQSFLTKSLYPRIRYRLRTLERHGQSSPQCVYWAFPSSSSSAPATAGVSNRKSASRGRWSSKGCELKGVSPQQRFRTTYDYINCSCDRAFAVAVVMDSSSEELYFEESPIQIAISSSLCTVSLILLACTILVLTLVYGPDHPNSNSIHKHIVICLLAAQTIFVLGLRARSSLVQYESLCKLVAIFLHYTFQCLFTWMLIQSVHLYRMLTEIRDVNHGPMRFYTFIGYAVPAMIVALSVGVRADQYGNHLL